jgi:hypothetical protein
MGWFNRWWRQSHHYDRLSSHLQARGMGILTRATIAVIAAGLSVDALGTIWTPTGLRGVVPLACTPTASVGAAGGALLWALRWPTRAMAIRFAVAATACIALIALAQHHTVIGAMYAAKRRGGNHTGHHHWPLPPRLDSFDADESDYRSYGLTA